MSRYRTEWDGHRWVVSQDIGAGWRRIRGRFRKLLQAENFVTRGEPAPDEVETP